MAAPLPDPGHHVLQPRVLGVSETEAADWLRSHSAGGLLRTQTHT